MVEFYKHFINRFCNFVNFYETKAERFCYYGAYRSQHMLGGLKYRVRLNQHSNCIFLHLNRYSEKIEENSSGQGIMHILAWNLYAFTHLMLTKSPILLLYNQPCKIIAVHIHFCINSQIVTSLLDVKKTSEK